MYDGVARSWAASTDDTPLQSDARLTIVPKHGRPDRGSPGHDVCRRANHLPPAGGAFPARRRRSCWRSRRGKKADIVQRSRSDGVKPAPTPDRPDGIGGVSRRRADGPAAGARPRQRCAGTRRTGANNEPAKRRSCPFPAACRARFAASGDGPLRLRGEERQKFVVTVKIEVNASLVYVRVLDAKRRTGEARAGGRRVHRPSRRRLRAGAAPEPDRRPNEVYHLSVAPATPDCRDGRPRPIDVPAGQSACCRSPD